MPTPPLTSLTQAALAASKWAQRLHQDADHAGAPGQGCRQCHALTRAVAACQAAHAMAENAPPVSHEEHLRRVVRRMMNQFLPDPRP